MVAVELRSQIEALGERVARDQPEDLLAGSPLGKVVARLHVHIDVAQPRRRLHWQQ